MSTCCTSSQGRRNRTSATTTSSSRATTKPVEWKQRSKICVRSPKRSWCFLETSTILRPATIRQVQLSTPELGPIPVRNWICLLIPIPIPELELELNCLFPVWSELELNWNCQYLNWNWIGIAIIWIGIGVGIAFYGIGFGIAFHGIEIRYEVPHILIYSRPTVWVLFIK